MKKTQEQMFYEAQQREFSANEIFLFMVHCKENPLTLGDFNLMAAKFPNRYERFRSYAEKNCKK